VLGRRRIVGRRLDRVSAECRKTLARAAIFGRVFSYPLLRAIADAHDEDELLDVMDEAEAAQLIALVKPMFELGLEAPPPDALVPVALARAVHGIDAAGWTVTGAIASPVTGHHGAKELLVVARRTSRT